MELEQRSVISKKLKYPQRFSEWQQTVSFSRRSILRRVGRVITVHYRIPTSLTKLDGVKLLFFSDLHCSCNSNRQLWHDLDTSIRMAEAEVIICGGDLPGKSFDRTTVSELLSNCRAPYKLAVVGNWDRHEMSGMPLEQLGQFYRQHGFELLCNRAVTCHDISFYGLDDIKTGNPQYTNPAAPAACRVLLAHNPDAIIHVADNTTLNHFDLALCGHTHAGQVRIPLLGPLASASRYGRKLDAGIFIHRRYPRVKLCISAGIGTSSFPLRLNCPPEIMLIEFAANELEE